MASKHTLVRLGEGPFAQVYALTTGLVLKTTTCPASHFLMGKLAAQAQVGPLPVSLPAVLGRWGQGWAVERLFRPGDGRRFAERAVYGQFAPLKSRPFTRVESDLDRIAESLGQGGGLADQALALPTRDLRRAMALLTYWRFEFERRHAGFSYELDPLPNNLMLDAFGRTVLSDPLNTVSAAEVPSPTGDVLAYYAPDAAERGQRMLVPCATTLRPGHAKSLILRCLSVLPGAVIHRKEDPGFWSWLAGTDQKEIRQVDPRAQAVLAELRHTS